jgi:hypothetical protein
MKGNITSLGGRTPPVRKISRLLQSLVRAPVFEILALQILEPRPLVRQLSEQGGKQVTF